MQEITNPEQTVINSFSSSIRQLFKLAGVLLLSVGVVSVAVALPSFFLIPTLLVILLFILSWSEYRTSFWDKIWRWGHTAIGLLFVEGSAYVFYHLVQLSFDSILVLFAVFLVLVFGAGLKFLWSSLPVLHRLFEVFPSITKHKDLLEILERHKNLSTYEDIKSFENAFQKLNLKRLDAENLANYHHLYGLCAVQYNDHEVAKSRFETALQDCPDNIQIMFSLAQAFIFLDQPDKAFPIFDRLVFPDISAIYILAMSRYAYLYGEHDRGIQYVMPLILFYKELKILDDTFLVIRKIPAFHLTWAHFAAHCVLSEDDLKIELLDNITMDIINTCQDYDFDFLNMEMIAVIEKRYTELVRPLKKIQSKQTDKRRSTGYENLRIAVLESMKQDSYDKACQCIDNVTLTDDDFPWLEDVCTLALGRAAYEFNEENYWILLTKQFFVKQPMMFEPNIALSFGLLEYQESIKHLVKKPFTFRTKFSIGYK